MKDISQEAYIETNAVEIVRDLQKLKDIDNDSDEETFEKNAQQTGRRRTLHNLQRQQNKKQVTVSMEAAFQKRLMSIAPMETGDDYYNVIFLALLE